MILLDSKCYPLLDNAATSIISFWKSTRKILAASKSIFQKLSGGSLDLKRANDEVDLTQAKEDEELLPPSKRARTDSGSKTLDEVFEKVDKIESKFTFISLLIKAFECVVCKAVMSKPMVSTCCQRIVGCCVCVQRWISGHNRCPHCSADTGLGQLKELKGLEEMLTAAKVLNGDSDMQESVYEQHPQYESIEESSDDDFETPRIRLNV